MDKGCILVTGGAGFIGGNFVSHALKLGYRVLNLDALTYAGGPFVLNDLLRHPEHHFINARIESREIVDTLLREYAPSAIINFAAETHVDRSIDDPGIFVQTNVVGVQNLLDAAVHYQAGLADNESRSFRFLQISTDEVFGSIEGEAATENSRYRPNSPYSASKAAADHLVRAYHTTYGLPTLVTVATNNYGPMQFPEKLIPLMIVKAVREEPLPVYGDGENVRDWLHVEDHCRAVLSVLETGKTGETYNVAGDNLASNLDIVRKICAALDRRKPLTGGAPHEELISFVADRPGHDRRYALDATKLKTCLGWKPEMEFDAGIEQTIDWYLENPDFWKPILGGSYDGHRMGLGKVAVPEVSLARAANG
ncbi:dTDP-glucose 4,6-dehydratase [Pelagibius sp. Alg239-R121]|uniref:dTDP-glucose 4,6-dehydratase n=1 Tax=Pelagibius sp. Alg239-R121 TaxID=2993448 RepID=UPI0024A77E64|nr:dTDP-glucose 4,6-dehydratase [Pelagibius sp. Alg239-R121]